MGSNENVETSYEHLDVVSLGLLKKLNLTLFELSLLFSTNLYVVTCIFCAKTNDFDTYEYMSNSTKTINKITRIMGG